MTPRHRQTVLILLGVTLVTSAVHFIDNALRLDLYPGPAWLTRDAVLVSWPALPALAFLAYRMGTRSALIAYALLGFAGLAHYLVRGHVMPTRCAVTIWSEAMASAVLIGYALTLRGHFEDGLRVRRIER